MVTLDQVHPKSTEQERDLQATLLCWAHNFELGITSQAKLEHRFLINTHSSGPIAFIWFSTSSTYHYIEHGCVIQMLLLLVFIHFNFISYIDISMDILDIIIETCHTNSFQRSTQTSLSSWPSEDKASADLSVRARRRETLKESSFWWHKFAQHPTGTRDEKMKRLLSLRSFVKGSMKNWTGSKRPFAEFTWFCCSPQPHMFSVFIAVVRMAPMPPKKCG